MDDSLIENVAKVKLNQIAFRSERPCTKALGGKANVVRASVLGLQNSDLLGLITAYLVLDRCLNTVDDAAQIKAYKEGVTGFVSFLTQCAIELETIKRDEKEAGKNSPSA